MFRLLVLVALVCANVALAVQPLVVQGADFVNSVTGKRFQIVGVAYQPGGSAGYKPQNGIDPLSDASVCLRDAALMQRLGVNAIRVYNLDPDLNHDACASIFNGVGIYMLLDVNSPLVGESINRAEPWTSYYAAYSNRTFAVVEAFKDYPNTLLFFAGNEVINDIPSAITAPYMRAVTRDLKNYIAKHSNRTIPVGYSAADVREILVDTWNYMQCTLTGDTTDPTRVDIFALNSYSWCGDSSFTTSGYNVLAADFSNTSVPVFFSEYGCNVPYPRVFTEVPTLYGSQMTPVLSGGLIYEFSQEESNYGLVNIYSNGSAQLLADFDTLENQFATLDITTLQDSAPLNTTVHPPNCTASLIIASGFNKNFTIPDPPPGVQALIDNGISTNPNNGKIISVTSTSVTQVVQASNGQIMTGLSITLLADDESNVPSGTTTTSAVPSSTSAPAATSSAAKKNGAVNTQRGSFGLAMGLTLGGGLLALV